MSDLTSERGLQMLSYLPPYYAASRVMRAILQSQGAELDAVRAGLEAILKQFFVATADDWGCSIWEYELNITPIPGITVEDRRENIIARLRMPGTTVLAKVKTLAESYEHGHVAVIEDHPAYLVIIRFMDATGIPNNLSDLQAGIRAILPAHLDVAYEYNYLVWDELDGFNWTWDALDALNLTWDELEVYA